MDNKLEGIEAVRNNLKRCKEVLEINRRHMRDKGSDEYKRLGQEIQEICREMHSLRPKRKHKDMANLIIDVIRPDYSDFEWELVMKKAQMLKDAYCLGD